MKSIYLDSVVISYYTVRLSSDIMVLSEQLKTKVFWTMAINKYKIFISNLVRYEIAKGDPVASAKRIEAVSGFEVLKTPEEAENLAYKYYKELKIPDKAYNDALHIAIACLHKIDYLITWNFTHIANIDVIQRLEKYNSKNGIHTTKIYTPDYIIKGADYEQEK